MKHKNNLKKIRNTLGVVQIKMSTIFNLARTTYQCYEMGLRPLPAMVAERILGHMLINGHPCSLEYIYGLVDEPRDIKTRKAKKA